MRQMDAIAKGTMIHIGARQRRVLRSFAAPPVGVNVALHLARGIRGVVTLDRQRAKALLLELPFGSFVRIEVGRPGDGRSTWYELA